MGLVDEIPWNFLSLFSVAVLDIDPCILSTAIPLMYCQLQLLI
jgi:hypothetical protein